MAVSRMAGHSPLVLDYPDSTPVSAGSDPWSGGTQQVLRSLQPILEKRYLKRIDYCEWYIRNNTSGVYETRWKQTETEFSLDMADLKHQVISDSETGTTYEYTRDDDGTETTTGSTSAGIKRPQDAGYTTPTGYTTYANVAHTTNLVSRTATYAEWNKDTTVVGGPNPGTYHWQVTITLSLPVEWISGGSDSRQDQADTLYGLIDIQTPGDDYSPSGATKYVINGVEKILVPMPEEYALTSDADYYIDDYFVNMAGGFAGTDPTALQVMPHRLYVTKERTGSGIASVFTMPTMAAGISYQREVPPVWTSGNDGIASSPFSSARAVCAAGEGVSTQEVQNTGAALNVVYSFKAKGKALLNKNGHRSLESLENYGGPIEYDAAWITTIGFTGVATWDAGGQALPFPSQSSPARVVESSPGVPVIPPEKSAFVNTPYSYPPGYIITWRPYYLLLEPDMATSSETNKLISVTL